LGSVHLNRGYLHRDSGELEHADAEAKIAFHWQGLTYCKRFLDDPESAPLLRRAVALAKGSHTDGSWEDLETLKAKVLWGGRVNPMLPAWSQGSVGDKTFQQITEQFADLIIPKVWKREGRKLSRVASRLFISPKKSRKR
jgi:hypothetical protein